MMAVVFGSSGRPSGLLLPSKSVKIMEEANLKDNNDPSVYGNIQEYLAREVKQYPCLYNVFCKDYKNVRLKERCWKDIGGRLGMEAEVCRAKWRNVRDRYVKEMRKERSGCVSSTAKPWTMIPKLRFLDVSINRRRSLMEETNNLWDPSMLAGQSGSARLGSIAAASAAAAVAAETTDEEASSSVSVEQVPSTSQDADISFLLSLLPQLRRIPDRRKNLLKIEMLQLIHKAAEGVDHPEPIAAHASPIIRIFGPNSSL